MGIEKIADDIEQAKLGYMEAVCGAAERAKAEIKAANGDRSRSGSWARERILGVVEAYEAERVKMAGEVMLKLKGLYDEGLAGAAAVLSKQPTSGEAAYLQAFMLKQRITRSDVEQAKIALQGSAVASSAMYDLAKEKGVDDESGLYLCRTAADAPEVDGNVCVSSEEPLYPGEFYDVLVDDSDLYDLYGTVAK